MSRFKYFLLIVVGVLLTHSLCAFDLALGKISDVKEPGNVDFKNGVSITGLISERTKRVAARTATAHLARDSKYLYLAVTSQLPTAPGIKLQDKDTAVFTVIAPNGKKVAIVLTHNGKGALPKGVLAKTSTVKKDLVQQIAIQWSTFGIKAPAENSVWQIQMGRVYQSPAERVELNLKTPAKIRMDSSVPALAFKAGRSTWATGFFPWMVWDIVNTTKAPVAIEGKADVTWIGNPIHFFKKETLAAGKKTTYTQVLSGGSDTDWRTSQMHFTCNGKVIFSRKIDLGGNGIYWQAPASEKTVFLFGIYPSYNTVSAQVYNRNSAKLKPFDTAHFQIVDAAGKVYSEAKVQKAGNKFYKEFHLPRLKDGKYFITGKLTGYNVKPKILEKYSFEYKRFPWEGNTIGLERVVIPPFKALSVNKDKTKVNATLTGYTFGKNLIEGVTAQGEEILTKPVTFSINGSNLALGKLNYTEIAPDRVRAKTSGKAGKFNVNVSYDIDYDGMIWVKMDLDGGKFGFIKDMRLEIPMKTEYARSLFAACARPRKHPNLILSDKMGVVFNSRTDTPKNFLSYVWFGEVYKGLCWFTETEKQWNYDPNKPTTQVIRKPDGSTVLVINMINRKTVKRGKFSLEMGFQATPVKPMIPNANKYASIHIMSGWTPPKALRMTNCVNGPAKGMKPAPETPHYLAKNFDTTSWEPFDFTILKMLKRKNVPAKESRAILKAYTDKYMSNYSSKLRNRYINLADHAMQVYAKNHDKLIYYFNPRACLMTWEPYRVFQDEWGAGNFRNNHESMYTGDPGRSYQDYIMPTLREFARNGLDGIYFDCTYDCDSIDKVTYPEADDVSGQRLFMNIRRLVKRTATMMYLENRLIDGRPYVEIHPTNSHIIPMMSFASHILGWEIFYGSKDYQDRFNEGYLLTESLGTQAGVGSRLLIEYRNDPERLLETALAVVMPYNLLNHMLTGGQITEKYKKTMTLLDNFGYRDDGIEIFPCYDPENPVKSLDKNIKLMTLKMKNHYLLCVGNTEKDGGKLDLDLSGLGFKNPCTADAFTGKSMGSGKRLTSTIPFHGYRLILVAGSPAELENAFKRSNPGK